MWGLVFRVGIMINRLCSTAALALAVLTAFAPAANAGMDVSTSHGSFGVNVISNGCTSPLPMDGPALEIKACVNKDHTLPIDLTSTQNIQFGGGGQASIVPSTVIDIPSGDTGFQYFKIQIEGNTIDKLVLNIDTVSNGFVDFTSDVACSGTCTDLAVSGNGSNWFTISGGPFTWVAFTTHGMSDVSIHGTDYPITGGVSDVEQIRLLPTGYVDTPEPLTLSLFGAGLAGALAIRRRKKKIA